MRTPQRARIERLEGKTRVVAQEAPSGAGEALALRLEGMAARMTPEDRAFAVAYPERVEQAAREGLERLVPC